MNTQNTSRFFVLSTSWLRSTTLRNTTRKLVNLTSYSLARASCYGLAIIMLCFGVHSQTAYAQEKKPTAERVKELEQQQKQLAQRFGKLEELFIRMSELEAAANPTRAGLLMQAAKMSKQLATQQRLSMAGDLLSQGQFTRAIQEQEAGRENLVKLLELLQSENRSTRLRDERARIQEIQQEIRRLEQIQRGQTARTESGQELKQAAGDQKDIKEQLEKVAKDLNNGKEEKAEEETSDDSKKDQDANDGKEKDGKQSGKEPDDKQSEKPQDGKMKEGEANPSKPTDGQEKEGQDKDAKPNDSQGKPPKDGDSKEDKPKDGAEKEEPKKNDGKPSDPKDKKPNSKDANPKESDSLDPKDSDPKDSEDNDSEAKDSKDSKPSEGESQSKESSKKKSPPKPESREDKARKRVEMARKRMQNAQDKLEKEKRDEAVDEQREAERELREAIDELERILRQLREEEIERSLVDVETRLRRMLDLQRAVREQTEKLGNLTGDLKDRTLEIQANKLSIEQSKVVMEGQKALLLLQDEGSSTAFPEALEQVNLDAQVVSKKLTEAIVSAATIAIEDEIIGALEEMLDSLKQVQKKREEKKKQPDQQQQQQSNNQEDEPLVDSIAELKLLKTLQLRINRRTQTLAKQTSNPDDTVGQIGDPSLLSELEDLAGRQQKIHEVTRDILIKNAKD